VRAIRGNRPPVLVRGDTVPLHDEGADDVAGQEGERDRQMVHVQVQLDGVVSEDATSRRRARVRGSGFGVRQRQRQGTK